MRKSTMTKPALHPVMERLSLTMENRGKQESTSRDILNYLLLNNVVKEEDVQRAYDTLKLATTKSKTAFSTIVKSKAKEKLPLNYHRYRHVALQFYYDGAEYSGLAENIGMENDQSIEKALFAALKRTQFVVARESCGYSRCGRTDRGVSSSGQVVAMQLKSNIPRLASWDEAGDRLVGDDELPRNGIDAIHIWVPSKNGSGPRVKKEVSEYCYDKILNNVLPPSIRVMGWCPVSPEFSARFSATTRTYRYFFVNRPNLDLEKMREGLQLLEGKHDFRNFCKMDVEKVYNFERLIHYVDLVSSGNEICYFQISGQAFLWHQIRCIVSILFMVGRGQEEPSVVSELLNVGKHPGKPSYPLAPERPLVLHRCGFHDLRVGHTVHNMWSTHCELERQWEELVLAAARIRNCIESMHEMDVMHIDLVKFARVKLQERIKKQHNRSKPVTEGLEKLLDTLEDGLVSVASEKDSRVLISWKDALAWLRTKNLVPSPESVRETAHIPLIQRHMGTTYEEKIAALSNSKRRHARYDENVIKKRKTKEEDAAFYVHMTKQGGRAM